MPIVRQAVQFANDAEHGTCIGRATAKASRDGQVLLQRDSQPAIAWQFAKRLRHKIVEGVVEYRSELPDR